MEYKIAVIPGDGIGVDVIREAVRSLDKIGEVYGHQFHKVERLVGGCCIDAYGVPIQPETLELCRECDAILFGAAGGPKRGPPSRAQRPESGLAALRRGFNLFCNLRPAKLYPRPAGKFPAEKRGAGPRTGPAAGAGSHRRYLLWRKGHPGGRPWSGRLRCGMLQRI